MKESNEISFHPSLPVCCLALLCGNTRDEITIAMRTRWNRDTGRVREKIRHVGENENARTDCFSSCRCCCCCAYFFPRSSDWSEWSRVSDWGKMKGDISETSWSKNRREISSQWVISTATCVRAREREAERTERADYPYKRHLGGRKPRGEG